MKVLFLPEVQDYFRNMSIMLYEENYFGIKENAIRYVKELFTEIETKLPLKAKRPAPPYFEQYGEGLFYAVFKKSRRTEWYVFFSVFGEDEIYIVKYVSNNHLDAKWL
jgi:hypothetical protein